MAKRKSKKKAKGYLLPKYQTKGRVTPTKLDSLFLLENLVIFVVYHILYKYSLMENYHVLFFHNKIYKITTLFFNILFFT